MTVRSPRWHSALLLLFAGLLGLYSIAGVIMAGTLQGGGYRIAVWIYVALFALSLATVIGILVWRWRHRDLPQPDI